MKKIIDHLTRERSAETIVGLGQIFAAAAMAADFLADVSDDWVHETTHDQRIAIMYGMIPTATASADAIERAIRKLQAI